MKVAKTKMKWKFPLQKFVFLRIEKIFLAVLSLFVFIFLLFQFNSGWALLFTVGFVLLYIVISMIIQQIRAIEEHYHLTPKHFHIVRKSKQKTKKIKIPLKEIIHHRLDKKFLGGYLITISGKRHALFFNTKKEVQKLEKLFKKHLQIFF